MPNDPVAIHIGKQLRNKRNQHGISQDDLGKAVGITFQQIQKYENGANRIPSSRLYELANALCCSVAYFFEGLEGKPTQFDLLSEKISNQILQDLMKLDEQERQDIRQFVKNRAKQSG